MSEQNNAPGHGPLAQPGGQAMVDQLTPMIRAAVHTTMRGLMTGFPGVPPHVVLAMTCFETGFFAGQALGGDIASVVQIRKMMNNSFADGVKRAPMQALKSDWVPPAGGQKP